MTTAPARPGPSRFAVRRRRPARPVWSVRTLTVLAIFVTFGVAIPTMLIGERSLLVRAEWVAIIAAALLWMLLFVGLYRGARVKKDEPLPEMGGGFSSSDWTGDTSLVDLADVSGVDDLVSGLIGLVLWIVIGVLLIFMLPMVLTGVGYVIVLLVAALMWVFRRALRQVFIRGPRCRGRFGLSLAYASGYTALYAGWLLAILTIAQAYQS